MNKYGVGTNKHVSGEKTTGFLYFNTLICMQPGVLIGHIVMCRLRVWFLNVLDLKKGINFDHFGLKIGCLHPGLGIWYFVYKERFFPINFGKFLALLKSTSFPGS